MRATFTLGRIAGIRVGIHQTWLLAFALISWSLAVGYFPDSLPRQGLVIYIALGVVGSLVLFGSVLVHELSHSLIARRRGLSVDSITLFIFGGVSNLKTEAATPGDEFLVAVVGPLTSLVLAAIAWALHEVLVGSNAMGGALLGYAAAANLALGLFNLVPGFPLDGGRVLRSVVWVATGSLRRATQTASYVGQTIGYLLVVLGVFSLFGGEVLNGVWIAFIGWFLSAAAESSRQEQALRDVLSGVTVESAMNQSPPVAGERDTVQAFVDDLALRHGERVVLVTEGKRLLGLVSLTDVKRIERDAWPTTPLVTIMTALPLHTVQPTSPLTQALELMASNDVHQLPVVSDGRVVGLITRAEILTVLQMRAELGKQTERP